MKITYDRLADALYICRRGDAAECRVIRLGESIALDFAPGEQLAGIEILDATDLFDDPDRPTVELENLQGRQAPD